MLIRTPTFRRRRRVRTSSLTALSLNSEQPDGYVLCVSANYADARAGTGSLVAEPDTDTVGVAGQLLSGGVSNYCFQSLLVFDASAVPDTDNIYTPLLAVTGRGSNTTDIIEAFVFNWGPTVGTADFRSGAALGSLTKVAELPATALVDGTRYTFTDIALAANISKTGKTYILLAGKEQRTNVAPTGDHLLRHDSADVATVANRPSLTFSYGA